MFYVILKPLLRPASCFTPTPHLVIPSHEGFYLIWAWLTAYFIFFLKDHAGKIEPRSGFIEHGILCWNSNPLLIPSCIQKDIFEQQCNCMRFIREVSHVRRTCMTNLLQLSRPRTQRHLWRRRSLWMQIGIRMNLSLPNLDFQIWRKIRKQVEKRFTSVLVLGYEWQVKTLKKVTSNEFFSYEVKKLIKIQLLYLYS